VSGGVVYVPFVDGRVQILNGRDGSVFATEEVGRPVGDMGSQADTVAVATSTRRLVGYHARQRTIDAALSADPSTGVLGAHGAFWVGGAAGTVDRIDAGNGAVRTVPLGTGRAPVLFLSSGGSGVWAVTGDGRLYALDAAGAVRWKTEGLGDVAGPAAEAQGLVAVGDGEGRLLLFDARSGAPKGQVNLDAAPVGGLTEARGRLLAFLADGRLWVHDAATGRQDVDIVVGADAARFPPVSLGDDRVAIPWKGGTMALLRIDGLVPPPKPDPSPDPGDDEHR
jgi:outer membrane protein assembly factor BamB